MKKSEARQRVSSEGGLDGLAFLETYQLMAYLGISSGKVRLLIEAGLPHGKNGGKLIFKREEVDRWCSTYFFSTTA
jgi:excisionase family DNA binding protein